MRSRRKEQLRMLRLHVSSESSFEHASCFFFCCFYFVTTFRARRKGAVPGILLLHSFLFFSLPRPRSLNPSFLPLRTFTHAALATVPSCHPRSTWAYTYLALSAANVWRSVERGRIQRILNPPLFRHAVVIHISLDELRGSVS